MIKYLRIPDEIFDMVKEDIVVNKARGRTDNQKNRAPRGAKQGIILIIFLIIFILQINVKYFWLKTCYYFNF